MLDNNFPTLLFLFLLLDPESHIRMDKNGDPG